MTLRELGVKHAVDKKIHVNLLEQYEEYLPKDCKKFLEIGCLYGNSARMFKEWYGDNTEFHLLDLFGVVGEEDMKQQGFVTYKGMQCDFEVLNKLPKDFCVISEDASHHSDEQIVTFKKLFKDNLVSGGLYVIEDCYGHFEDYWRRNIIEKPEHTIVALVETVLAGGAFTSQFFTPEESDYFKANISDMKVFDNINVFIWKK